MQKIESILWRGMLTVITAAAMFVLTYRYAFAEETALPIVKVRIPGRSSPAGMYGTAYAALCVTGAGRYTLPIPTRRSVRRWKVSAAPAITVSGFTEAKRALIIAAAVMRRQRIRWRRIHGVMV